MNIEKLFELLRYIMKFNSWYNLYPNLKNGRRCHKYIDFSFDTRDGTIWQITFREDGGFTLKESKTFRLENEEDLKKVYEFLDTTYKK